MEILTLKGLKKIEACSKAIESFEKIFGTKAKIENVVKRLHNPEPGDVYSEEYKEWESWLLSEIPELTKSLLDAGADVHARNDYALRWAAEYGHTEVVKLLLDAGADVHVNDDYALRCAAEDGYTEVVKLLLDAGADVHAKNDYALHWATKNDHTEVIKLLEKAMKKE